MPLWTTHVDNGMSTTACRQLSDRVTPTFSKQDCYRIQWEEEGHKNGPYKTIENLSQRTWKAVRTKAEIPKFVKEQLRFIAAPSPKEEVEREELLLKAVGEGAKVRTDWLYWNYEANCFGRKGNLFCAAALSGKRLLLKKLLDMKADQRQLTSEHHTAMHYAVRCVDSVP
jgi:hypothetical protein